MSATMPMTASNATYAFTLMGAERPALPGLAIGMYAYTVGRVDGSSGWLSVVAPKAPSEFLVWLPTLASTAILSWLAWREFAR